MTLEREIEEILSRTSITQHGKYGGYSIEFQKKEDILEGYAPSSRISGVAKKRLTEELTTLIHQKEQEAVRVFYAWFSKEVDAFMYGYDKGEEQFETYLQQPNHNKECTKR